MAAGCFHWAVIIPTQIIAVKAIQAELKGAGPTRVTGIMERAKAAVGEVEPGETRIGVTGMVIPGTGTTRGRGKVRLQAK